MRTDLLVAGYYHVIFLIVIQISQRKYISLREKDLMQGTENEIGEKNIYLIRNRDKDILTNTE